MSDAVNTILADADYFVLLFFRVGALFISSPVFGRINIPNMAKIAFMASLTYLFFLIAPHPPAIEYSTLFAFFLLVIKEVVVGLVLAFATNLFFTLTYTAGQLIDMQIGFGIVNVYDPQNNTQIPLIGNLLNIILLLLFFSIGGYQRLIYLVFLTLEALPVGTLRLSQDIGLAALEIFVNSFVLGVMVALPVIASGITIELTFGTLIRTVPQMNMFIVGIPLKTFIGFIMLLILIPAFGAFSERIFSEMFSAMDTMFGALRGV